MKKQIERTGDQLGLREGQTFIMLLLKWSLAKLGRMIWRKTLENEHHQIIC